MSLPPHAVRPPIRPPRRSGIPIPLIVLAVVVTLCSGVLLVGFLVDSSQEPEAAQSPSAVALQLADLPVYWQEQTTGLAWAGLAEVPTWDGEWLTVKTQLHRDGDAREPAIAMCALASGYWVTSGRDFRSVRVLDKAGAVLVYRMSVGEQCTWRG